MKIETLAVTGLHGYLDKIINFNSDINLLVGINGSGKTSILNLINWMLTPSIAELCLTRFHSAIMDISHEGTKYRLRCVQTDSILDYYVERPGARELPKHDESEASRKAALTEKFASLGLTPEQVSFALSAAEAERPSARWRLRAPLLYPSKGELPVNSSEWLSAVEEFNQYAVEPHERRVMDFLLKLPTPLVVGLDRGLGRPKSMKFRRSAAEAKPAHAHAKELVAVAFKTFQNKLIELNNRLKDRVMSTAFEPIVSLAAPSSLPDSPPISLEQVDQWETRVLRYMASGPQSTPAVLDKIKAYFNEIRQWIENYRKAAREDAEDSRTAFVLQTLQFRRTQKLIEVFEEFETASERAYAGIRSYLTTLNAFFSDSGKILFFKRTTGELCFRLRDDVREGSAPRNVESLSSGEKQLIILFTHLCFDGGNVFIIDEPELSLHPKWQEEFLPAFIKLTPKETQLIMATHSAAIVGRNVRYCQTLLAYNK
jgi:predicted ATPase